MLLVLLAAFLGLVLPILFWALWLRERSALKQARLELEASSGQLTKLISEYAPITSIETEVAKLRADAERISRQIQELRFSYSQKHEVLLKLEAQVAIYDEKIAFAELGIYEPHFDCTDSEAYKKAITEVREKQKEMVSAKSATICPTNWTVDGSRAKGQTMINRQIKLTMRAFNNECEAAIANTRWNNVNAMEKRIRNAATQINKANDSMRLAISERYVALKVDQLHLTHEYRERLKIEREERVEMARAEREEKRLLAEAEAAERDERKFQALLEKARAEAGVDEARIAELEAALADAHATSERARAMAEMTKSGYVYIISNIGSFGPDIVKIGLTRRLEPDDRVRELGDASVPFGFDTHAMIYSDEAPALEAALHKKFADRRVNDANMRKEFFRVTLEEVEDAVRGLAPTAAFFKDREAQEWHETLARRKEALMDMQKASDAFPAAI
ncbi:DUF4041 domain-containing protein [Geminicoccaceae bacterium 1502E]|nr:DUF4041 domain-containing protein [Geminicoccaceae bacterium 1502E]